MGETKQDEAVRFLIVTEPVADLLREPVDSARRGYECHDLQETQLLLNEVLLYLGENDDWYRVEAIEQSHFTPDALWRGYPGWVRKGAVREVEKIKGYNAVVKGKSTNVYRDPVRKSKTIMTVSIGTRFRFTGEIAGTSFCKVSLPKGGNGWVQKRDMRSMTRKAGEKQLRRSIVNTAKLFLGVPYLWGGRSMGPAISEQLLVISKDSKLKRLASGHPDSELRDAHIGVDCSGLINLVFRVNNIDIPRNAHVQWLVTPKITHDAMQPGDLIFMSSQGEFSKISHVMIFLGGDEVIEALETGAAVKTDSFRDKFGKSLVELAKQDLIIENKRIYCGKMPVSK
jgi:gamma-D-glutamyl-L-lysine dipeptidyl-peptidase